MTRVLWPLVAALAAILLTLGCFTQTPEQGLQTTAPQNVNLTNESNATGNVSSCSPGYVTGNGAGDVAPTRDCTPATPTTP
jgi:hypothetical protein